MSLLAAIEGIVESKQADAALVRVGGGVTLRVYMPGHDLANLPAGETVRLLTHLIVREDDLQLYGFASEWGRRLFESLLGVSGVGPKAALSVLSVLSPQDLASAIVAGDSTALSRAHNVGKRTAERIIVDLQSKLEEEMGGLVMVPAGGPATSASDPALAALVSLGFSALEARQALSSEPDHGLTSDERVRQALQRMGH